MTPRVITLKYQGRCQSCRKALPAGTRANWAGKGKVFCLGECEEALEDNLTWKERYGQCEDAPCCGCCGQNVYGGY